jgi:hypothetical protein
MEEQRSMSEGKGAEQGSGGGHLAHEAAHWTHLAHEAHLSAEAAEAILHTMHHAGEYVKHLEAAAKLQRAHSQMAYDLRRMANGLQKLRNVARQGGNVGAKAAARLVDAERAYVEAKAAFEQEKIAARAANTLIGEFRTAQSGAKMMAKLRAGQLAVKFEEALQTSRIGSGLMKFGKIVASKAFVRGLVVVGSALEAVSSYADSTAQTTGGKVANAALGAGSSALLMSVPLVAGADVLTPEGYKLSEIYHGGAGAITAIGEGMLTSDTRAMDEFHKRSMAGHYGKVMQAASEAGEYWADKGFVGGMREFADAVNWWVSH